MPVKEEEAFRCRECGESIVACPECGGWLRPKVSKYGPFLGCSNYPKCKYTRDDTKEKLHSKMSAWATDSVTASPANMRRGFGELKRRYGSD